MMDLKKKKMAPNRAQFLRNFNLWISFVWFRPAQDRREPCWSLTPRCQTRSPSLMLLCLILEQETRNLVFKLAQSALMVNELNAGDNSRRFFFHWKSCGHFLHAGKKPTFKPHIYESVYLQQYSQVHTFTPLSADSQMPCFLKKYMYNIVRLSSLKEWVVLSQFVPQKYSDHWIKTQYLSSMHSVLYCQQTSINFVTTFLLL